MLRGVFFRFLSEERRPVGSKRLKSVKLAMILAVIRGGSSPRFSEKAAFAEGKKSCKSWKIILAGVGNGNIVFRSLNISECINSMV